MLLLQARSAAIEVQIQTVNPEARAIVQNETPFVLPDETWSIPEEKARTRPGMSFLPSMKSGCIESCSLIRVGCQYFKFLCEREGY